MGSKNNNLYLNGEGYPDPTAFKTIKRVDNASMEENDRFHELLETLFYITENAGFEVKGRIVLKDKITGRVWR